MGYSLLLTARVLLYALSHRQDNTYLSLCYTSRGALAGTRNSSMGPPRRIDPTTYRTMSERSYHGATSRFRYKEQLITFAVWVDGIDIRSNSIDPGSNSYQWHRGYFYHIKEPLLLIGKSSPCGGSGFLSHYLSGPLPYVRRHIT